MSINSKASGLGYDRVDVKSTSMPKDGWQSWTSNPMVEYLVSGNKLKFRFKCRDKHPGWVRPLTGSVDDAIRQQLREMSGHSK